MTELGINFDHILQKSWTVLNPLATVDAHMMDDADLAGPLVFCLIFAMLLLLVRSFPHLIISRNSHIDVMNSRGNPNSRTFMERHYWAQRRFMHC